MKKPIIYLSVILLAASSFSCGTAEKEENETQSELEAKVNEEQILEMEKATEELQEESIEMQEEVSELSNEVDSILNEI